MKSAMACMAAVLASWMLFGADAAPSRKVEDGDDLPIFRGIEATGMLREIKWCLATGVAEYRDASTGKPSGKVGAGSLFLVEGHRKADRGYDLVVRFRSRPKEGPYLVHAGKVQGMTGSFESLSEHQKKVYAAYYRLRAQCDAIRQEVNRKNGELSPYYKDAIEAQKKFDAQTAEVVRLEGRLMNSTGDDDGKIRERLSQLKGEMSVQREKLKELSRKHADWKKSHASSLDDPEKDPKYSALKAEMEDYAKIIPGLAI